MDERQGAAAWPGPRRYAGCTGTQEAEGKSHAAVSLRDNRRAGWILTALLTLLSLVMALSKVVLDAAGLSAGQLAAGAEPEVVSFWAMLQITPLEAVLENWWPTIPALGLLWRWRAWQVLGATLAYWLLCSAIEAVLVGIRDPISAGEYLALVSGVPLLMLGLLCLAPTTRAIAPWLLPLFLLLLAGSLAGEDLLGVLNERTPGLLEPAYSSDRRSWGSHRLLRAVALVTGLVADPSARPRTGASLCAQVAVGNDSTL